LPPLFPGVDDARLLARPAPEGRRQPWTNGASVNGPFQNVRRAEELTAPR
jgi:hypothetical protein